MLRSLFYVPGDRPERMRKALGLPADALILDLEDSVTPQAKPAARDQVVDFLREPRDKTIFIRVNAIDSAFFEHDIDAVIEAQPSGIVIPKFEQPDSILPLLERLDDTIKIVAQTAETAASLPWPGLFKTMSSRVCALTWGAEDLSSNLGATRSREADDRFSAPLELARSLTLFSARAAGVEAIETIYPDFRNSEGLAIFAARARRDGFGGMLALHPAQIPIINAAFTPSDMEIEQAQRIVEAFAASDGVGAINIDGKMYDLAHLSLANKILGRGD